MSNIICSLFALCNTTQFNVTEWLSTDIGTSKQGELLNTVCHGLSMCGCNATTDGADVLLEVSSFSHLIYCTCIFFKWYLHLKFLCFFRSTEDIFGRFFASSFQNTILMR